jgi:hypothetical protein
MTLTIDQNNIGDEGTKYLADALLFNKVISKTISFSLNWLFNFYTQSLITLMIANNHIGDEGALYLADALRNNKVIYIIISFCLDFLSHFLYRFSRN